MLSNTITKPTAWTVAVSKGNIWNVLNCIDTVEDETLEWSDNLCICLIAYHLFHL